MRTVFVVFFASLLSMNVKAQQISGLTQDDQNKPLAGASISLKKNKDSSVVKLAVSNSTGNYEFSGIPTGTYFISTSHIGYTSRNSPAFETKEGPTRVPVIVLVHTSAGLKEVVVTSQKPPVEVKADKIILNVEGSTNAVGQDALDLLRKSPGVTVDKDNNLSLSGKNGVQIYIDGKPTPLSGNDLSEYLKTIQSSSIESIEIISNPSAKYEAAGNAGIINIKLKKNRALGTNGSINAGYNIGTYSKYNAGLSLNHRDKDINVFGNYSYNHNPFEYQNSLHREQLDTLFDQHSIIRNTTNSHNFKAGLDYFINKKSTLGLMANGTYSDNSFKTNSNTPISYIPTGQLDRLLVANNHSNGRHDNTNINLNYRYADTSGHELTIDADYGAYHITNDQLQPNFYYDPSGKPLDSITYNMLSPSKINIYSLKSDYEQNFLKGRLGFGFKTSYVTSGNNFEQYDITGSNRIFDSAHSNNFDYRENINAIYGNYNRSGKGWTIQAGLRIENTNTKGTSTGYTLDNNDYIAYDSGFHRHYVDFFPSGAITYNKNPAKQWSLNYSRRIDRPAYQDLNPFEFKLDEYTFQKGNTLLKPQYTNSIGLTYTYKYKLTATLNYSHVKDVFTQLLDTVDKSKAFLTKQNLATQHITSLNISYPFQYKWYSLFANVNTYYSHYNANFGTGRTVDINVFAANIYTQQTAKLGHGWTGEVSGIYNSPSIWQGTFKTSSFWTVDGGLSRTLLKGNATLKASVSDIFNTLHWSATSRFAGQYLFIRGSFESRLLRLYFTYRFGNTQVKAARQHKTGAEDENKRVN